ncbi:helix-turn-helix transcriptional regulator [Laribacter hongkongensis]|uniref:helix-turn-helix transcriptional regulator n=1 Tax=Laribacter hongkongensis TaxID=168471 RepID=UPI0002D4C5B0|nr:AlpA family phage regulatory protein [Laribacter hongkongensis]
MQNQVITLPQTGFVRQPLLVGDRRTGTPGLLPFSASTLWRRVRNGTFPSPVKLSERVTAWRAEDVRTWIESAGECQQ